MPRWTNKHHPPCPVSQARHDMWRELYKAPTDPVLLGAVPEYDNGGDQERELCTCGFFPLKDPPPVYLIAEEARAIALALRAFAQTVDLVLGPGWSERLPEDGGKGLMALRMTTKIIYRWADRLDHLADIWGNQV